MVGGIHPGAGGSFFFLFIFVFLKRGNVLCIDQKLSGFVISGAAVPPASKEAQCSWTTHRLLFTEEKRTSGVGEMLALFMSLRYSRLVRF